MKLYATVKSERASKGQGGNNELVINIKVGNESRREIANIVLRTSGGSLKGDNDNAYALEYYPVNRDKGGRIILDSGEIEEKGGIKIFRSNPNDDADPFHYQIKGKQQKGESSFCPKCHEDMKDEEHYC